MDRKSIIIETSTDKLLSHLFCELFYLTYNLSSINRLYSVIFNRIGYFLFSRIPKSSLGIKNSYTFTQYLVAILKLGIASSTVGRILSASASSTSDTSFLRHPNFLISSSYTAFVT